MTGLAFWFFWRNYCLAGMSERADEKKAYCCCHPPPSAWYNCTDAKYSFSCA
jgi:hypothetical protein